MKKTEVKTMKTQDLILCLCKFFVGEKITKREQKEALYAIEELMSRGVIEDDIDFVKKSAYFFRWDCMPERYKSCKL